MNLRMSLPAGLVTYKSPSQIARVVTENWGQSNLYCAACDEDRLSPANNNTHAFDFECRHCCARYQLKSSRTKPRNRIVDSVYATMRAAIESDNTPNLLALHYSDRWTVVNLLLIPSFCFSLTAIEKRKPLAETARRAGWIGCNILLGAIAPDAKIPIIDETRVSSRNEVRARYTDIKGLKSLTPSVRGWTLDVLNCARSLDRRRFSLAEMYGFEEQLSSLYPSNRNIRPKIRQQMQVLRDLGFLRFVSRGEYEFVR
jgi:type II restriction enzyme